MGIFGKLFEKEKQATGNSKHSEVKALLGDERALLPSFPAPSDKPYKLYKAGDFYISLMVDAKPLIHERFGDAIAPLCLLATNIDRSVICSHSAQYLLPNQLYHVVWQPNGQLMVNPNPFKSLVSPETFLGGYFAALLKDVGLKGSVEITEMTRKPGV